MWSKNKKLEIEILPFMIQYPKSKYTIRFKHIKVHKEFYLFIYQRTILAKFFKFLKGIQFQL